MRIFFQLELWTLRLELWTLRCCSGDAGKSWALKKSAAGYSESRLVGKRPNRVSEERGKLQDLLK